MSSPFLIPEDDRELNALRKALKSQKLAPSLSPEPSSQDVPVQEWSTYSDVPTFNQLNATLRQQKNSVQATPPAWQPQREDMRSVLAQKRNILLVMMAVDTKRTEIAKLKQHTAQRGAALSKGEQLLSQDTAKFDGFLKENDEKLQQAMQEADAEVKAKQEKVAEIKRLHAAAALVRSELSKLEEQLDECKAHRDFLMRITPPDFFTNEEAVRTAAANARLTAWQAECDAVRQRRSDAKEAEVSARQAYDDARTQQEAEAAEAAIKAAVAELAAAQAAQEPDQPVEKPVDPDELPMFFQEPHQLLAIYGQLEQENLFLIQASQEAEEGLEAAQAQLSSVRATMQRQTGGLDEQIVSLQAELAALQATPRQRKASEEETAQAHTVHLAPEDASTLDALAEKVAAVYEQCGFEHDSGLATVQMLGNLEARLEELSAAAFELSPEVIFASQRQREKDRRQVLREQKLQQQKQEHEDRVQRNQERASAPSFQKRKTKPAMTRSVLPKKVVSMKQAVNSADAELDQFLLRDFSQV